MYIERFSESDPFTMEIAMFPMDKKCYVMKFDNQYIYAQYENSWNIYYT